MALEFDCTMIDPEVSGYPIFNGEIVQVDRIAPFGDGLLVRFGSCILIPMKNGNEAIEAARHKFRVSIICEGIEKGYALIILTEITE